MILEIRKCWVANNVETDTWPLKQDINIKLWNNEQFYSRKTKRFKRPDHEHIKIIHFRFERQPSTNRDSHWLRSSKLISDWTRSSKTVSRVRSSMAAPMSGVEKPSAEPSSLNTTSFQKKTRSKLIAIPGSRPSVQNGQLLVSTGVTSLDYLLG